MWAIQSSDGFSALPAAAVTSEIHVRKYWRYIRRLYYVDVYTSLNAHAHARVSNARCQTGLNFGERSKFAVATFLSLARGAGGVGHDHVCAIFADSAPSNVCEFPIIGDRGISAGIC